MLKKSYPPDVRRPRGELYPFTINHINLHNPFVVMWWSAALPGLGHIVLCKYFKGFVLLTFEILINVNGHLNQAIAYSFQGDFEQAKHVLLLRWVAIYAPVWLFGMWDSYRSAIDLNKLYLLADKTGSGIKPVRIGPFEINYLDKRDPWAAVAWTVLLPGLGHLYANRLPSGFILIFFYMGAAYFSNLFVAIAKTVTFHWEAVVPCLHTEWLLFLPSLIGFSLYDAYFNIISLNMLFRMEQSRFLQQEYQDENFPMPVERQHFIGTE